MNAAHFPIDDNGNRIYEITVAKQNVVVSADPLHRADRYYPFPTGTASNGLGFNTKAEAYDHIIQSIERDCGHDNPTIWWNDVIWEPEPNPVVRPQFFWQGEYYDQPTVEEMEEWLNDCGCETPAGDWTEPDDPDSWLSLLGLI